MNNVIIRKLSRKTLGFEIGRFCLLDCKRAQAVVVDEMLNLEGPRVGASIDVDCGTIVVLSKVLVGGAAV